MKRGKRLKYLLLFLPLQASAHGEDALISFAGDILVLLILLFFIFSLKWKMKRKVVLLFVWLFSSLMSWYLLGNLPYEANKMLITWGSMMIPVVSVLIVYLWFCLYCNPDHK